MSSSLEADTTEAGALEDRVEAEAGEASLEAGTVAALVAMMGGRGVGADRGGAAATVDAGGVGGFGCDAAIDAGGVPGHDNGAGDIPMTTFGVAGCRSAHTV